MKKNLLFLILCVTFVSCKKDKGFSFEEKVYQKILLETCIEENCTEIKITTPEITPLESEAASKINLNNLHIINEIFSFDNMSNEVTSYNQIVDSFIAEYTNMAKKFPKKGMPWQGTATNTITFYSDELLSFSLLYYTFTGGAHGYEGEKAIHYNPTTGEQYTNEQLFKDWDGFKTIVEAKLRNIKELKKTESISSQELLFDEDEFKMPENIFFYEDSVVAFYNSYDITAFSDDPISISFTKEEVTPYLKLPLIQRINTNK